MRDAIAQGVDGRYTYLDTEEAQEPAGRSIASSRFLKRSASSLVVGSGRLKCCLSPVTCADCSEDVGVSPAVLKLQTLPCAEHLLANRSILQ